MIDYDSDELEHWGTAGKHGSASTSGNYRGGGSAGNLDADGDGVIEAWEMRQGGKNARGQKLHMDKKTLKEEALKASDGNGDGVLDAWENTPWDDVPDDI